MTLGDRRPLLSTLQSQYGDTVKVLGPVCAAGDVPEWLKLSKNTFDTGKSSAVDGMKTEMLQKRKRCEK